MPKFEDEFYNYDHLRFLSGRGLTNPLGTGTGSTSSKKHAAHQFTSDYFDYSLNYNGKWGKYIGSWGNGKVNSYRQIDTDLYKELLRKYPGGVAVPSNFAVTIPGAKGQKLNSAGLIIPHNSYDDKLTEALFDNSKPYDVMLSRISFVDSLYTRAVAIGKEKSAYIVLDHERLKLEFLEAQPSEITSSDFDHIQTNIVKQRDSNNRDTKVKTMPVNRLNSHTKQVIGTLHTHYFVRRETPMADGRIKIETLGYGPSDKDIADAKLNSYVNYIVDDKSIHRVDQNGVVKKNLPRNFDILIDCIGRYSEMYI